MSTPPLVLPQHLSHFAEWFWQLSAFRPPSEHGEYPLQPGLIADWQADNGVLLTPLEKSILYAMDRAFCVGMAEHRAEVQRREAARNKAR